MRVAERTIRSAWLDGVEAVACQVTATRTAGPLRFVDRDDREQAVRVGGALAAAGLPVDAEVRFHPAPPFPASELDLPAALAVAGLAGGEADHFDLAELLAVGELTLDGRLRLVRGVARMVASPTLRRVIVPAANRTEAVLASRPGNEVVAAGDLAEARRGEGLPGVPVDLLPEPRPLPPLPLSREALGLLSSALASRRPLLLEGPPGCGKTALARRLPAALPPPSLCEREEVVAARSAAGLLDVNDLAYLGYRPFRAPHHTCSTAAFGGAGPAGARARPGEAALAHRGVLLLDDLGEWSRATLEVVAAAFRLGSVQHPRGARMPAVFWPVLASPLCPCGLPPRCVCRPETLRAWEARRAGVLALFPGCVRLRVDELAGGAEAAGTTADLADLVKQALGGSDVRPHAG
jgi:magnesium chelatase family protein